MTATNTEQAAALLASARRGALLAGLPDGLLPTSLDEAYAIQDATLGDGAVGAWKVAPSKTDEPPRCAPIPRADLHADGASLAFADGRGIEVEIEIAVRLGADLPPLARPRSAAEIAAAIAGVHAAIEVLSSRYVDRKAVPPLAAIADLQSNAAVILGSGRPLAGAPDFADAAITVTVDGRTIHDAPSGPGTGPVTQALGWLADHVASRRGGLKAGDVIITGARVGPFAVVPGAKVEAAIAGIGRVSFSC